MSFEIIKGLTIETITCEELKEIKGGIIGDDVDVF